MKYFAPALTWGLIILALSIAAGPDLPAPLRSILSVDKLAHALAYFVFATLLGGGVYQKDGRQPRRLLHAAGLSAGYGVAMELVQYGFFPYRQFEFFDIIANIIGSLLGFFVTKLLFK